MLVSMTLTWINAIERDAILHSVQEVKNARAKGDKNAGKIDEGLVKAGNIRRLLDRIFGYGLSGPVAERLGLRWGESAVGRTQTGGMALIEQREKEIQNFVPSPYWVVVYKDKDGTEFRSQPIKDEKEAEKIRALFAAKVVCSKYEEKKIQEQRKPALTLSTAMGLGIKILKLSSAEVTSVLQNLFEEGLTTYPRTDLEQKFPETEDMIRKYMSGAYPDLYMPTTEKEKASWQKKITDGKSQGAHECIHPTKMDAAHAPDKISGLSANGHAMYDLIWKATAASAARPAEYSVKNVELASDGTEMVLKAAGSIMTFPGWRAIAGNIFGKKEDKEIRGTYAKGKAVSGTVSLDRKMTTPPERFDEKTFLERLEKEEIGRPSTFSEIVSKQTLRGHSKKDGKGKFFMQPLGEKQMELLHKTCAELADPKYTARMEEMLDLVSNGKIDWKEPVAEAWTLVEKYVANLERAGTAFRLPDSVIETIRNSASRRGSGSWGSKKTQGGGKKSWSKTPGKGTGRTR